MNDVRAVCYDCEISFSTGIHLGGSNCAVTNCSTTCPKCGASVPIPESYTDSEGNLHVRDIFSFVRNIRDTSKLQDIKSELEAANNAITANELADALVEVDPSFSKFRNVIKSIPANALAPFINIILSIITLIFMYRSMVSTDEYQDESLNLQREQTEISRQQLELQKQERDNNKSERDIKALEQQINRLQRDFENKLNELENKPHSQDKTKKIKGTRSDINKYKGFDNRSDNKYQSIQAPRKSTLKGALRNKDPVNNFV